MDNVDNFFLQPIFWLKISKNKMVKTFKKPAAVSPKKLGTASPKKGAKGKAKSSPKKPEKADGESEPEMAEASEEAEPGKAAVVPLAAKSKATKPQSPSPKKVKKCQPVKAEPKSASKLAKAKAKAKAKGLPAPEGGKNVWVDLRNQVERLAKKGKPELKQAWQKAQEGGRQSKRDFYYNVFLLSPEVATRSIEKDSLQEETQTTSLKKGWMTMFTYGRLQGLDPQQEDFQELCLLACKGLPTRDHENPGLAAAGVKQVYAEVQDLDTEQQSHKSLVKAKQQITGEQVTAEAFASVEDAVKVAKVSGQITLGGSHKQPKEVKDSEPNGESEPGKADTYEKALKKLTGAVGQFNSQSDKARMLLEGLKTQTLSKSSEQLQLDACKQSLEQAIVSAAKGKEVWLLFVSKLKQQKVPDDISEKDLKEKMQEVADAKGQIEAEVGAIRKMIGSQKQVADQLTFK